MNDLERLGMLVKTSREAKGMSQSTLARECKLAPSYISKIETIKLRYSPSRERIIALANALEIEHYEISLIAGYIPEEINRVVFNFLLAYSKEEARKILEDAINQALIE